MFNHGKDRWGFADFVLLFAAVASLAGSANGKALTEATGRSSGEASLVSAAEFSPSFLGMYRKIMLIEGDLKKYSHKYDVDPALARAVCMYESGGNAGLRSSAGARGYFQVMPATFRSLGVRTNIEAGVKYLGQLVRWFGREDYALAAYNGGPTRVAHGRVMPLETQQYVLGVRSYWKILEQHEPLVRENAKLLHVATIVSGDNWWRLSQRLKLPLVQLRLYNPFLATRTLKPGYHVVYPPKPRTDMFEESEGDSLYYRTRLGDNPISLAFALGVEPNALRQANELEPVQSVSPGTMLEIPLLASAKFKIYRVTTRDDISLIARRLRVDPWSIVRDNLLWDEEVQPGMLLRIREPSPQRKYAVHRVRSGENLSSIARNYHTTVRAIQRTNKMGRTTLIRIGKRLRIELD